MKTFTVTVNFSHESFGGYDHNDGTQTYKVKALTDASAEKKALKLADEYGSNPRVTEIWDESEDDE